MRQHRRCRFTQTFEELFKHHERFTLIFVKRVFLPIGAQRNTLAQLIKAQQMFLPLLVKHL